MSSPSYNSDNLDNLDNSDNLDNYNDPYNESNGGNEGPSYNESPSYNSGNASYNEEFSNLSVGGINTDLILKSIFYGAIFYLLSLPEVYKMTSGIVGKKVDGVLLHGVVFAILYYILTHFI
jgi:hypothetical protein